MTLELWQVIHDSWQTCTLFFGSLWVTTKNVSSIGSLVEELWLSHDSWLLSHDKLSMTHGNHAHCSLGHYESPQKISAQLVHWLRSYKVMSLIEPELSKGEWIKCSLSPKSPGNCLAGVILNSVRRGHQSAPTCWTGNTYLKGFHAQTGLGTWAHYYYAEYPRSKPMMNSIPLQLSSIFEFVCLFVNILSHGYCLKFGLL